jgi:membrane protein implicated in regulation of membrane protease activity
MEQYMIWVWLAVFVIAVVVEALTQDLVSIWFSVGGLVCLCICNTVAIYVEVIIFAVVSLLALVATRPLVKKMTERSVRYTNVDEIVGKRVKALSKISKYNAGEIKVNGVIYSAILLEEVDGDIEPDSIVEIVAIKGNKIVVKEIVDPQDSKIELL